MLFVSWLACYWQWQTVSAVCWGLACDWPLNCDVSNLDCKNYIWTRIVPECTNISPFIWEIKKKNGTNFAQMRVNMFKVWHFRWHKNKKNKYLKWSGLLKATCNSAAHAGIIHIPIWGRLTQFCCQDVFFFYISIWSSGNPTTIAFLSSQSSAVIYAYISILPLALVLNRPPRVSNLSDKFWTNGFSWAGICQCCRLKHRKQGLVLSCPPSSTRDGCWDVSQGTGKKGEAGRGNMANLLILSASFFLSH